MHVEEIYFFDSWFKDLFTFNSLMLAVCFCGGKKETLERCETKSGVYINNVPERRKSEQNPETFFVRRTLG